jgi:vitamin K-dependent gamma-carboxylase
MFPFIMSVAATLFFAPDWPRALGRRLPAALRAAGGWLLHRRSPAAGEVPLSPALRRAGFALAGAYLAFQVLFPLRHHLYPGDVLWNEQGMRWSWKVMVREKHGSITYRVHFPDTGKTLQVPPRHYLTRHQEREMAGQPDLVLQLAHHIAEDFRHKGHGRVEVRAEALVSLNGRRARPMIDPDVDLARVPDDLAVARWITAGPTEPPIRLARRATPRRGEPR